MKQLIIILHLFSGFGFSISSLAQQKVGTTPRDFYWKKAKITKAKAFLYFSELSTPLGGLPIINEDNQLSKDILPKYIRILTKEQVNLLAGKLSSYTPNDSLIEMSLCFNPHHALVFYDSKDKVLGHISICFACNRYELKPKHPNHTPLKMSALKVLMQQLNMPLFDEYAAMERFMKKEGFFSKIKTLEEPAPPPNKKGRKK